MVEMKRVKCRTAKRGEQDATITTFLHALHFKCLFSMLWACQRFLSLKSKVCWKAVIWRRGCTRAHIGLSHSFPLLLFDCRWSWRRTTQTRTILSAEQISELFCEHYSTEISRAGVHTEQAPDLAVAQLRVDQGEAVWPACQVSGTVSSLACSGALSFPWLHSRQCCARRVYKSVVRLGGIGEDELCTFAGTPFL